MLKELEQSEFDVNSVGSRRGNREKRVVSEAHIAHLQEIALRAGKKARADLRAKGIDPVVLKDGKIVVADD